jgi:multisubunit Na+/H+ antiporter MnhF subunit
VNVWLAGATALLAGAGSCGLVALRGSWVETLVALQLASTLAVLSLVLLAQGFQRASYLDVALVLALCSAIGTLAYARFLPRL